MTRRARPLAWIAALLALALVVGAGTGDGGPPAPPPPARRGPTRPRPHALLQLRGRRGERRPDGRLQPERARRHVGVHAVPAGAAPELLALDRAQRAVRQVLREIGRASCRGRG